MALIKASLTNQVLCGHFLIGEKTSGEDYRGFIVVQTAVNNCKMDKI